MILNLYLRWSDTRDENNFKWEPYLVSGKSLVKICSAKGEILVIGEVAHGSHNRINLYDENVKAYFGLMMGLFSDYKIQDLEDDNKMLSQHANSQYDTNKDMAREIVSLTKELHLLKKELKRLAQ